MEQLTLFKWPALLFVLVMAASLLGGSWALGNLLTRPGQSETAASVAPAEDLRIATADGLSLAATFRPGRHARAAGVLFLHGNHASRASMEQNARWLAAEGYAVLTVDFRGHGQSTPHERSFGLFESRDAAAALAWLKHRLDGAPVAVVGISLGGASSLLGDDGPIGADALILQAVYPDIRRAIRNRLAALMPAVMADLFEPLLSFQSLPRFGVWPDTLSPVSAIRRYPGPVLVIGGEADNLTPPDETRSIFDAAPGPKDLWFAEGADHMQASSIRSDAYRQRVLAFLHRWIGLPPA